ncbi:MAG TPA: hypothetical protein VF640_07160 [Acidimicrobiales bacterium]|jgi:hypothetical protein
MTDDPTIEVERLMLMIAVHQLLGAIAKTPAVLDADVNDACRYARSLLVTIRRGDDGVRHTHLRTEATS